MLAKRHPSFMYAVVMSAQLKVKKQSWSLIERFPAAAWRAHSHAAMHAFIQWRTPTAFSASVSVSLGLFLDKLLWHCCGFSRLRTLRPASTAHSSVTVPQSKMNKNPLSSLKQNRGRSIKNAKKLTNKNLWHRYFIWLRECPPKQCNKMQ